MPEAIVIQVGQCGNQIGSRFWQRALREHAANNPNAIYDRPMSTFFRNNNHTVYNNPFHDLHARGIMIDMEQGVIDNSPALLNELFAQPHQRITATDGSGNNWAVGHHHYGPMYRDMLANAVRREAELCDTLQSIFLIHSLGGGTGSGLGTYLLELVNDEIAPEASLFSAVIVPGHPDDVVTSPYNTTLALHHLSDLADAVLPMDNQALIDVCSSNVLLPRRLKKISNPFDDMNDLVAQVLLNLTASMRFQGPLNVDISEVAMNLVPFPRLKYLLSSLSPTCPLSANNRLHASSAQASDSMFTEAFSRRSQLIKCDPRSQKYLACAVMVRSKTMDVSDLQRNIDRIRKTLTFTWWNNEGWKTGLCRVPPLDNPHSLLTLANNTCVGDLFSGIKSRFMKLYSRKANLHHYAQHMDTGAFAEALTSLNSIISGYNDAQNDPGPSHSNDWEKWARSISMSHMNSA